VAAEPRVDADVRLGGGGGAGAPGRGGGGRHILKFQRLFFLKHAGELCIISLEEGWYLQ
jgi:hypothetical protein